MQEHHAKAQGSRSFLFAQRRKGGKKLAADLVLVHRTYGFNCPVRLQLSRKEIPSYALRRRVGTTSINISGAFQSGVCGTDPGSRAFSPLLTPKVLSFLPGPVP